MASHPLNCNCPKCDGHHHAKKHDTSTCPIYTEFPQINFKRGAGAERDICTFVPKAGESGSDPRLGWQDIYRCHLGSKPSASLVSKYGKIPACPYNAPPAGTGGGGSGPGGAASISGTTPSSADQCGALLPFGSAATDGTPALLNDIKYFQDQEMIVLNQLQQESVKSTPNEAEINAQTALLRSYQDSRIRLMQQLKNISSQTQCSLASDRTALQDQLAMMMLAEDQLKTTEKQTQELINERNNKHRMIEITNYEYDRYSSHKDIFRTIAFCSLFVLAGIYIGASGNSTFKWIGYPMVVIAIAVAIFLTIKKIWWNYYRNERNWKQFEWGAPHPHGGDYETVWQHDKRAFEKAWSDTKYEAGRAEKGIEHEYGRAKRNVEKAYHEGKKDIQSAAADATKTVKNQLANKSTGKRENFAPFR